MNIVIRFRFTKGSEVRFLSHLDQLRTMERALRRAKIPMAYSEGFTPRPIMSFSFPLSVGVLSEAEYGDFELKEALTAEEFRSLYNSHLPPGFRILEAQEFQTKPPALMSQINAASWKITVPNQKAEQVLKRWDWLQGQASFFVERQTRKGPRKIDLLPLLFSMWDVEEDKLVTTFHCSSSLGETGNLRIEELARLLEFDSLTATIRRTGQFIKTGSKYLKPLEKRG